MRLNAIEALVFDYPDSEFRKKLESELLFELFQYYKIDTAERNGFGSLALRLARNHVPGFRVNTARRVGRPKKRRITTSDTRKVGRPRADHKSLLLMVNNTIRENNLSGRGAIKRALEIAYTETAKKEGHSVTGWVPQRVKAAQKEYSRAVKLFPEMSYKYRK